MSKIIASRRKLFSCKTEGRLVLSWYGKQIWARWGQGVSAKISRTNNLPKSFHWLNVTQFCGAFNDNALKLLMIFFLITLKGPSQAGTVSAVAGAVLVVPFLVFSSFSGVLADRFSKQRIIVTLKVVEIVVTSLGTLAFLYKSEVGLYAVLFLMGTHSALFAPSKYGVVPELVSKDQLSKANGLMESFTYLAVILGTVIASLLVEMTAANYLFSACFCIGIAVVGLIAASQIPPTKPVGTDTPFSIFFIRDVVASVKEIRSDRELLLAVLGTSYLMFLAAFTQINLIPYGMQTLGLIQEQSGYLFLIAALGIGAGSLIAGKLSGRCVEFGVVPIGAIGLTAAAIALQFAPPLLSSVLPVILVLGLSAGLFIIPLQAFIQLRSPDDKRGEILAASVFLNWVGVLMAAGITYVFSVHQTVSAGQGFMVMGVLTLVLTLITLKILPDFLVRFLGLILTRLCYWIKIIGAENIPLTGPALLVSNHVSWVDVLLINATQQRRIRFVMERRVYENRFLNPLFRLMQVIPVSSEDGPKKLTAFFKETRAALDDGYLVCIFAEGSITRNGLLNEFRPGFERILKGSNHPIIPVYIGGIWGSIFSYAHGKLLSRLPMKLPYPVIILFGAPLSSDITPFELHLAVTKLSCDYFEFLKQKRKSLGELFIKTSRKNWSRSAISDTTGKKLSYGRTLTGALALAAVLEKRWPAQDKIGILLPPSVGGVLANLAATLLGRTPVNLNYTASIESFSSSLRQCGIQIIITSRVFLEKMNTLPPSDSYIYIEDVLGTISASDKRKAWLKARLFPVKVLTKKCEPDDIATIIFSSGSTGEPKGVMLTHHNILSNIDALRTVFRVTAEDNICAALPFFHSLGFTGTIWFPLLSGFSAVYHANPLDGAKIAEAVREHRSTLLLATPTFLLAYLRRATREDFASLRIVMTGAEKLKPRTADAFEARFGLRPLEGYGATELSPVITLNLPDVEIDGVRQTGAKQGSAGHPITGVAVRVVDPETGALLPPGESGLIQVKGPNLMLGYLNQPEQTAKAVQDGWYVTGDIGWLDKDGFLTITDRLARFSKIGGEMVPHIAIEEALHAGLGSSGQVLAVTAVPDEKKGEKLAVLYTKGSASPENLVAILSESTLPNLWKPGRDCYFEIETLPILGTGKLDIRGLKQMAIKLFESKSGGSVALS